MTQISEGNKTHYAIFPENYLVVDDTFYTKLSTARRAVGWTFINEIVCGKWQRWGFVPLGISVTEHLFLKFLPDFVFAFQNRTLFS